MSKKIIWVTRFVSAAAILVLLAYLFVDARYTDSDIPVFSIADSTVSVSIHDSETVLIQGVTAWDDTSGDISDAVIIENIYGITKDGRATVTYAVSDASGNTAKADRVVHYIDYTSPRISLSGPLVFEYGTYFDVLDHIDAYDVFEGDISRRIKPTMLSTGTSVGEEGTHDVQFRVTNSMGDTSQLVLPVEVYGGGSYNAQVTLTDYLIYLPLGATFEAKDYLLQLDIQGHTLDLTKGNLEGIEINIGQNVNSDAPGVYPVTYTVTMQRNGKDYTGYTKLLVVIEA